jgi:hypothetical protein
MLARILAQRLRQVMADQLQHTQFYGVPGNCILDATSQVRDVIAHADNTGTPLCIRTLDFHKAFDRIARDYLFQILQPYGIRHNFIDHLRARYSNVTASVQINDTLTGPIPILCRVRQGCPLIMTLYTLCLHPLLSKLDHSLQGPRNGRWTRCRPLLAYADVVTLFVTHPAEFATVRKAIQCFEKLREHSSILPNRKPWPLAVGQCRQQN